MARAPSPSSATACKSFRPSSAPGCAGPDIGGAARRPCTPGPDLRLCPWRCVGVAEEAGWVVAGFDAAQTREVRAVVGVRPVRQVWIGEVLEDALGAPRMHRCP